MSTYIKTIFLSILIGVSFLTLSGCGCEEGEEIECEGDLCSEEEEGTKKCASTTTFQVCTCTNGCCVWSAAKFCGEGYICKDGTCWECYHECEIGQKKCVDETHFVKCVEDGDDDPCKEYDKPERKIRCDEGKVCCAGACEVPEKCVNECNPDTKRCNIKEGNPGFETCIERSLGKNGRKIYQWGNFTPCTMGEVCVNGKCIPESEVYPECAEGSKKCFWKGYYTCGRYGSIEPQWSANITECPAGQTCSFGKCSSTCKDECQEGEVRCSPPGYQECGEANDGDTCKDWLLIKMCPEGQACSNGECLPIKSCQNECPQFKREDIKYKLRICDKGGAKVCDNYDQDACNEWSLEIPCEEGETCVLGACKKGKCVNECDIGASRCIGYMGRKPDFEPAYQECGENEDGDPCLEWTKPKKCEKGKSCSQGRCIDPGQCKNECLNPRYEMCIGFAYRECGNLEKAKEGYDKDKCFDLAEPYSCGPEKTCSRNETTGDPVQCRRDCDDDCKKGTSECIEGDGMRKCGQYDTDSCLDWSPLIWCKEGDICRCTKKDGDQCTSAKCETPGETCPADAHECPSEGTKRCAAGRHWQECGNYDSDPCREWGIPHECPENTVCDPETVECKGG
jgi:hypothetical protein